MNGARNAHADREGASTGLASWYVPGYPDGFGDRLLMFDNTSTPSLALLRFHRTLAASPGFEEALRERVRSLSGFRHEAFASVRAVQHLDDGDALTLVSEHAQGQRLSEIFEQRPRKGLNPGIVTWLLRELTPALAALQNESDGMSHGALTPDRIFLTPGGRLRVVEHVPGSALLELRRSPAALWREFSVFARADEHGMARLDAASDVTQLAAIALSMLLARPVTLQDVQLRVPALLDEFTEAASVPGLLHHVSPLRQWLERALVIDGTGYRSAEDAQYDVQQLPSSHDSAPSVVVVPRKQLVAPSPPAPARPVVRNVESDTAPARPTLRPVPRPDESRTAPSLEALEAFPSEAPVPAPVPAPAPPRSTSVAAAAPVIVEPAPARPLPVRPTVVADSPPTIRSTSPLLDHLREVSPAVSPVATVARARERGRSWLVAAMALAIVAQTAVIALLVTRPLPTAAASVTIESSQPGDEIRVNGQNAGHAPMQLNVGTDIKSIQIVSSKSATPVRNAATDNAKRNAVKGAADAAAAPPVKAGGLRLVSTLELKIFEGSEAHGSSADGVVQLAPGAHQLDLVNTAVGYRSHQAVTIKSGETTTFKVALPDGSISINAEPWAYVILDKKEIGETPLANIAATIGEHDIGFRHPKLGEIHRTVLVKNGEVTRVGVKFDQ